MRITIVDGILAINSNAKVVVRGSDIDTCEIEWLESTAEISKEDINKITTKFYRVQKNSWNNSLGLGLFLVKNIIKLHKFDLQIESKLDIGSKFIIKIK